VSTDMLRRLTNCRIIIIITIIIIKPLVNKSYITNLQVSV